MEYRNIKTVHWEPSQACNAHCPMCDRNQNGGEVNHHLTNAHWKLSEFKESFNPEFFKTLKLFYSCGNHGDPHMCEELIDIYKWIKDNNPNLRILTTTNGGARKPEWWAELADYSEVNFSVDGLHETNHLYRQGVKWENLEENIVAFNEAGGDSKWTFLVFRHNEHQVDTARNWSKVLGCNEFIVKKSGRYINTASLKEKEGHQSQFKGNLTQYLQQPKQEKYQNKELPKFGELESKYGTFKEYLKVCTIDCKAEKKKEIYISAEGHVTPCCWLHGQPYKWWRPTKSGDVHEMIGNYDLINLKKVRNIKDIIEGDFFQRVKDSWKKIYWTDGRLETCALKCNIGYDPFTAQWQ